MALGKVAVNDVNNAQGDFKTVERQLLFIGHAGKNAGQILYLDQTSELDYVLGVNNSKMKTAVHHARLNAGPNWTCIALPQAASGTWQTAFETAMDANLTCEGVVITDPLDELTAAQDIADMNAAAIATLSEFGRRLFFLVASRAFNPEEDTWDEFVTEVTPIPEGISAYRVGVIAEVYPGFLGALAGRLCNEFVSIADSPMRVKTGTLVGIAELPNDKNDSAYTRGHAKALNDARFTVPMTYPDYAGIYTSDAQLLDVEGGDFQVLEYLRPVDAASRRIRVLAIHQIANRELNNSAASTEAHISYFARPITQMSKSRTHLGKVLPGDVRPPKTGDITITWLTNSSVDIQAAITPWNSPKSIGVGIGLNLSQES